MSCNGNWRKTVYVNADPGGLGMQWNWRKTVCVNADPGGLGLQVLGAGCEYWDESESLEAVSESTQSAHMYVCEEACLSRHGCFSVHCCVPGRIPRTYTIMVGEVEPFRSSSGENLQ